MIPRKIEVKRLIGGSIPYRGYVTHGIDRYPAKMVPHLARYAIERVSQKGELILDPFCGCGTVQVECLVTGRSSVGLDINPVAVTLAKAKSAIYDVSEFLRTVRRISDDAIRNESLNGDDAPPWLAYWFTQGTLRKLISLRRAIVSKRKILHSEIYYPLLASLIISVRKCSRADPRSPKPFISKRARKERIGRHFDAISIFSHVAENLAHASTDFFSKLDGQVLRCETVLGDARCINTRTVGASLDAVVTSPPYLSAQDYYRSSKLELAVAGMWSDGIESILGANIIGSGRGGMQNPLKEDEEFQESSTLKKLRKVNPRSASVVNKYLLDIRQVVERLYSLLKDRGNCCLVVGDSTLSGIQLPVHEWFIAIGEESGFRLVNHDVDTIKDRHVPPKRERHASVIESEHLLFFEKR